MAAPQGCGKGGAFAPNSPCWICHCRVWVVVSYVVDAWYYRHAMISSSIVLDKGYTTDRAGNILVLVIIEGRIS